MKIQVVIPAAGQGLRFKQKSPKPLVFLEGKPLIVHTLDVFQRSSLIKSIIVVAPPKSAARFWTIQKKYKLSKITKVVAGGKTRRESVSNGLKALDADTDYVLIHDGARPFLKTEVLQKAILAAKKFQAVVVAVPVKSTVKSVDPKTLTVEKTLDRKTLWEIQTPQIFKKEMILRAHAKIKDKDPSDDALLVERLRQRVKIVRGDYRNIKITTPDDLILAKNILVSFKKEKV